MSATPHYRIMIVVPDLAGGGAERIAANLASAWAERDHKVLLMTWGSRAADSYTVSDKVGLVEHELKSSQRDVAHRIGMILKRIIVIRKEVQRFEPDFVIGVMTHVAVTVSVAAFGRQTIGCEHTFPPRTATSLTARVARWASYGLLSAVTGLTENASVWLRKHTLARSVITIPNPVRWPIPNQAPQTNPLATCAPARRILMAAGRLDRVKGFDMLLMAFGDLAASCSEWDLVVVGEGPERADLEARVDALGLHGRVFFPGRVGNIADWYQSADLFALSSRNEGLPGALMEAMACGLPVVSFDCEQGPRDIIRDGIDGLLVPCFDVPALSSALKRMMDDDAARTRMGRAATQVREQFSEHAILEVWDDLFLRLTASTGKHRGLRSFWLLR
jgi:glycosyltransferase involved in cell wall biosynthesis